MPQQQMHTDNDSPRTILVAEDNPDDIALFKRAFAKAGLPHQLRIVSSGLQVVDYLEGNAPYHNRDVFPIPGVLLLDMTMPQGGGTNVLNWLRSHPFHRDLPVVVLTGSDQHERAALDLGAKDFFVKPAATAELVVIFRHISQNWLCGPFQQ
jgi:CheY-like chemotaxis protein